MALPLLAVAQGAFNIGKKIFGGIKARQEKKKAKRAAKQLAKDSALAELAEKFGIGSSAVSAAGNSLVAQKVAKGEPEEIVPVTPGQEPSKPNNQNQMTLIIAGAVAVIALLLFKKR